MKTILIVEDDPLNRRLFELVLDKSGFRTVLAEDVPQARREMAAEKPDLIVLDVQLPGIDGLQFARELRACGETRDLPIVAVSANAMDSHRRAALDAGCTRYITKPIDTRRFTAFLSDVLDQAESPQRCFAVSSAGS